MTAKNISSQMAHDHRLCDHAYEAVEKYILEQNYTLAEKEFLQWKNLNLKHFSIEEEILFPQTVSGLGAKIPPIMVMEMEHIQIKKMFDEIEKTILTKDSKKFHELAETCLIMIQQHNMKEEQILYPIIDRATQNISDELQKILIEKLAVG